MAACNPDVPPCRSLGSRSLRNSNIASEAASCSVATFQKKRFQECCLIIFVDKNLLYLLDNMQIVAVSCQCVFVVVVVIVVVSLQN